jgi:hypothetical protein
MYTDEMKLITTTNPNKAKANYPQIIKASVMKIDQHIIVTLLTNKNLKLLVIMINIFLFLW